MGVQEVARPPSCARILSFGRDAFVLRRILEIGLDLAVEPDRHRPAIPVEAAPGGNADPALRDAIFDDAGLLVPVELDADTPAQQCFVIIFAGGVERESPCPTPLALRRSTPSGVE
jgi:hypothetical protein